MKGCTSSVVLSSPPVNPLEGKAKRKNNLLFVWLKPLSGYETSSLPQRIHTLNAIYASSIPPSARLYSVWNASHESTRFILPPAPEFGRQLRSAQTSRCFRQSIKSISPIRLTSSGGCWPIAWLSLLISHLSLFLPCLSLKKGVYFITLLCSPWSKFQKG